CYIISLAAALERARFDNITIKNESIGTAQFNQGKFSMIRIVHKPTIFIDKLQSNRLQQRISKLTQIADEHCMISNSIRGNI
ncbi:peroxiredoxin, partial [Staphylococcus warneri]